MSKINNSLGNGIYSKKSKTCSKQDQSKFIKTYQDSRKDLFNILARYMIVNGRPPKSKKIKEYYDFFSEELDTQVSQSKRYNWLCQVARAIERNQHKDFNIKELEIKIP